MREIMMNVCSFMEIMTNGQTVQRFPQPRSSTVYVAFSCYKDFNSFQLLLILLTAELL